MIQDPLKIKIDFRLKKSIGEQIYTQLQRQIREERIGAGERLPTVRELASRLSVNFNTVARVYRQLDREGLISTQHGRGTYIVDREELAEEKDVFSIEAFLKSLDAYLQAEAERYGKSPVELWEYIQMREETTLPKRLNRKNRIWKNTRKPGSRTTGSLFPTHAKKHQRHLRTAGPTPTGQK